MGGVPWGLPVPAAAATQNEEALLLLGSNARRFDVVFSDVVMSGMSGIEMGQEIHRDYPGLPVVLSSGYSQVLAQSPSHGFALLPKPYSIEALAQAMDEAAAKSRSIGLH